MAETANHPQTAAERLIAGTIQWTWALWLVGGLYIAGPVLGWVMAGMATVALYLGQAKPGAIPSTVWIWLAAMLAMLLILWVGHANFELGIAKTIKSSIGWAKGWALIALFVFAGALLDIRASVIYRAVCKLGLQTLIFLPIFLLAPYIGLPELLWTSPLKILGGAGPEYFAAQLYTIEPGAGSPRWQFFAPWSPAAGMMGVLYVLLSAQEKHRGWKAVGIAGGLVLALFSQSRLALVALIVIVPFVWGASRMGKGHLWLMAAPAVFALGIFGPMLIELVDSAVSEFSAARADSSRVRAALGRIAIHRWETEAYWFGHGIVENGPHLVEYMPIGSHHSWYGLLFVKGLLGAASLAVPLVATFLVLLVKAQADRTARAGLGLALALVLYSFGENLEILAYLYWPALVVIGIALRRSD
ncbi:O-antigen ligase domain-containing protein [Qipengyuania sp. S6317L1]|uniref:O-antigen ligase domain-containing protein n=1 Tax=Qipengyuania sp. S6317L1 TaxID=2926410 RepID=UPI001FF4FF76|nr:O-antigen ligase domain-containing protein [Qipengyuania sp. S6317L1]MCK0098441.1 O-antigen ligase domain-containing protein [Qipengyuania sp. S6317L1]